MPSNLNISIDPKFLDVGSAEERSTFGTLSIIANSWLLTEGASPEHLDNPRQNSPLQIYDGPNVSAYPLAEWFAWNWWRLRWEAARPHQSANEAKDRWDFSHRMTTIGDGYIWPNIVIYMDGDEIVISSKPSLTTDRDIFRYVTPPRRELIPATHFESSVEMFVCDVLESLRREGISTTNLHRLWADLKEERNDPNLSRFRRTEAELGRDPDEIDETIIQSCLRNSEKLGENAWGELAADLAYWGHDICQIATAEDFQRMAHRSGFEVNTNDIVDLVETPDFQRPGASWKLGESLARQLRAQEHLDGRPVSNDLLTQFSGIQAEAISRYDRRENSISYALDEKQGKSRIVLHSKRETRRRFELARLIGDRLVAGVLSGEREILFPATATHTYRQRAQRAFAAELLSPFHVVDNMLGKDSLEDRQMEVAGYFNVSLMTIRTQLVNNHRLDLDDAPDVAERGSTT